MSFLTINDKEVDYGYSLGGNELKEYQTAFGES
jgi:hypothetical protein